MTNLSEIEKALRDLHGLDPEWHKLCGQAADAIADLQRQVAELEADAKRLDALRALVNDICDLFCIGADARSRGVILTNVQNAKRRSECLNRVEWEFFTTTETDEDGWEYEECPLNWGANSQEYAEQFRAALAQVERETEARVREAFGEVDSGQRG